MFRCVIFEADVAMPVRDGTILRADAYRPDTDSPGPVVVSRLPYNKADLNNQSLGIDATSSSVPRFDRNPYTGHAPLLDSPDELRPARLAISHDSDRPSHIALPAIPR